MGQKPSKKKKKKKAFNQLSIQSLSLLDFATSFIPACDAIGFFFSAPSCFDLAHCLCVDLFICGGSEIENSILLLDSFHLCVVNTPKSPNQCALVIGRTSKTGFIQWKRK